MISMGRNKKKENYEDMLKERFTHWEETYKHGCKDPFWPDGVNLNLIRNHIIYAKRQLEQEYPAGNYPDLYYRETPQKVEDSYMARSDEIKTNAVNILKAYQKNTNYKYLKENVDRLTKEEQKQLCIHAVLGYVEGLKHYINTGDLVGMRRHETPNGYIRSIKECADKVRSIGHVENREIEIQYTQSSFI